MKRILIFSISLRVAIGATSAYGACLLSKDAQSHVGESTCVCGNVVSTHYAPGSRRQPTFLNLDLPYPNQIFTAVIFGEDRLKFNEPETAFDGKKLCVNGTIELYKGKAEIIVHDPNQLKAD